MKIKTGLGQDSHTFCDTNKPLVLAGVVFDYPKSLNANSDGDVVFHSITNAISSITGVNVLGAKADALCKQGVVDSAEYLKLAFHNLKHWKIQHIAISIECLHPKISPMIEKMKFSISKLLDIVSEDVGITATTGEGLTESGKGNGIQVFSIITVTK
ncbi:2-C-methyl-D-erythritol 2,4-cyclodiphosphate synthase [Abyssogena phaseoliformis symbiont OG214]|uniref:2-C-methyl-D-erythritol 2,4-cyclodiphosphate synthase n=1 Tax=Abyssogena phaseoliformis symbiont TaxID=596095 RepID=UPI001914F240|nr:2-C-methyl-D-erythritol 2,4-cyclodiphosphate synthase [Abyssogena phaseoliformis symbiont]MBW5289992.1 2-C-methyl-D-erythritol 2,4-cyclodiphosphate synthase [Candidatus Ruthia sp. Apha_13_S6]BBB22888.1 2-C-methyl-D-erythritol 2,4-cyclodiphosphate synthase [Abyssogena phaseoliformis symbiont OG214]